jgi:hypothetical protein
MPFYGPEPFDTAEAEYVWTGLRVQGFFRVTVKGHAQKFSFGFKLVRDPHWVGGLAIDVEGWTGPGVDRSARCTPHHGALHGYRHFQWGAPGGDCHNRFQQEGGCSREGGAIHLRRKRHEIIQSSLKAGRANRGRFVVWRAWQGLVPRNFENPSEALAVAQAALG